MVELTFYGIPLLALYVMWLCGSKYNVLIDGYLASVNFSVDSTEENQALISDHMLWATRYSFYLQGLSYLTMPIMIIGWSAIAFSLVSDNLPGAQKYRDDALYIFLLSLIWIPGLLLLFLRASLWIGLWSVKFTSELKDNDGKTLKRFRKIYGSDHYLAKNMIMSGREKTDNHKRSKKRKKKG